MMLQICDAAMHAMSLTASFTSMAAAKKQKKKTQLCSITGNINIVISSSVQ